MEILLSNALGSSDTHGMTAGEDHTLRQHKSLGSSIKDRLASSIGGCLDVTLEIQKKLAEIEGITRHLPVATEAKIQKKMASDTLKVGHALVHTLGETNWSSLLSRIL